MILPPVLTLVDLDGFAVPVAEKDIPHVEPDPTDPADWPAWTDDWFWETTDPADLAAADAALEDLELPPLSGGAPAYEPTAEDLADYHAWSEELDRRRESSDRHSPDALGRVYRALYGTDTPHHA